MNNEGYVQKYPCSCHESGICWVVRHPDLRPPISYDTEEEATIELNKLRKMKPEGPVTASKTEGA